jgi:hypothetical protein
MQDSLKLLIPLVAITAAINIYFLYRYNSIEYNLEVDTDITIRKLNAIEEKINTLINKE